MRKGMFDDEWIVTLTTIGPDGQQRQTETLAYGVSVTDVREIPGDDAEGAIKVSCLRQEADTADIVLPQPTMANGPTVRVLRTELMEV